MLAFFNDPANFANGEAFTDYTNPRTGVKQIKVQHPEFETFLGEGSQHRAQYTCADCHMPVASAEDGSTYPSHNLISPLDVPELIEGECSKCHADLVSEVHAVQEKVEARTYSIGYELEFLTEMLADAVESGSLSEKKLDEVRALARDAQFYWDFVFVENSEGAHNPELTYKCLDKAEELTNQALAILREK
jgi:nitrite reductase (cytochrome c-552)